MKLENCGRCGHEAFIDKDRDTVVSPCPCCGNCPDGEFYPVPHDWNTDQRRIRTDRINAASLALMAASFHPDHGMWGTKDAITEAHYLIAAQDAAAQARFKAQGGE